MKVDSHSFELTADAVFLMNESVRDRYSDALNLLDFMYAMAYLHMYESSSFSTGGFQLTAFDSRGERHVIASVSPYTALKFAQAVTAPA